MFVYDGFTHLYHFWLSPIQDPRILQKPVSPNLSKALQNQNIRTASYTLPDGTIVDPRQKVKYDLLFFSFSVPFIVVLLSSLSYNCWQKSFMT